MADVEGREEAGIRAVYRIYLQNRQLGIVAQIDLPGLA